MTVKFQNIEDEYEFAKACAKHSADKLLQAVLVEEMLKFNTDNQNFKKIIKNFTEEIHDLSNPGFACAIDHLKENLAAKIGVHPTNTFSGKSLDHKIKENITINVDENLKGLILNDKDFFSKRKILIEVITDFHILKSSKNENEYYLVANKEAEKRSSDKQNKNKP